MKSSHILGLNARNHLYQARYNSRRGKMIADSKLSTKKFLTRWKVPHPRLIAHFENAGDVARFDWKILSDNFVIKPAGGYAGEGIILVRKRIDKMVAMAKMAKNSNHYNHSSHSDHYLVKFQLMDGSILTLDDLKLHVLDILEGRFDKYDLPGTALIEERIPKHPQFRRYAYQGTPDVRVIVFNRVPVMAALRLPTPESRGRANLHLGAIMCGVDLATGITTSAVLWDRPIRVISSNPSNPSNLLKLSGIQIPFWDRILELSVEVQEHVGLGYMAVDFLLDAEKGPLIVELTARPGLGIQLANGAGLRRRLERVEGLDVPRDRGIEVGKALFAEGFADKIIAERGVKVVSIFETAKVRDARGRKHEVPAKIDTGAFRTSIDESLARELGLLGNRSVLWHDTYVSSLGRERRPIIPLTVWLGGRKIETAGNVSNRSHLKQKLLIGRRDLSTFMVRPGK